jgi:hypothetical protein
VAELSDSGSDRTPPPHAEDSAPANRAERRARRRGGASSAAPGAGKVRPQRFDHATDPRQFAAHRRG